MLPLRLDLLRDPVGALGEAARGLLDHFVLVVKPLEAVSGIGHNLTALPCHVSCLASGRGHGGGSTSGDTGQNGPTQHEAGYGPSRRGPSHLSFRSGISGAVLRLRGRRSCVSSSQKRFLAARLVHQTSFFFVFRR